MTKFKVTKARDEDGNIIDATYEYRGVRFERNDSVATGYWNRYTILISRKKISRECSSQTQVKYVIDKYLAEQGETK